MKHVYSYSAASGIEARDVVRASDNTLTIATGISGEVIRRSELDTAGARYFTTPQRAIEVFIDKAQAALADPARKPSHAGWRDALAKARALLKAPSTKKRASRC